MTIQTASGAMFVLHGHFQPASTRVAVFLHGVGASWTTWTPMLIAAGPKLADLGNILLVDLPGFGASEPRPTSLDATAIGRGLVQACAKIGYRELDLVGHSMGGYLAMAMASNAAPEIKSVCCLSGAYFSVVAAAAHPASALLHHPRASVYYRSQLALSLLGPLAPRAGGAGPAWPDVCGTSSVSCSSKTRASTILCFLVERFPRKILSHGRSQRQEP